MLAFRNRAFSRNSLEKYAEAEADLTKALALGAEPIQVYTHRAVSRQRLGNTTGAAADRAAADACTPRYEADYISRGKARYDAKDYELALADFEAANVLNPRSLPALINQVHVLADRLGKPDEALGVVTRMTEIYSEYVPGHMDRAVLLARTGKRADAHAEAERALKLSKDPALAYRGACVYALTSVVNADDQHRALALLDRAVKERYPSIIELTKDPDLDALRETERFQEIEGAIKSLYR